MPSVKLLFPVFLLFSSLACTGGLQLPFMAAVTATPVPLIEVEVTVVYPTPTPAPVILATAPATTTVAAPPAESASLIQSPLLTGTPAITSPAIAEPADSAPNPPPAATPTVTLPQPATQAAVITETTVATPTEAAPPPPVAAFILLEPVPEFVMQPGVKGLEFKWRWLNGKSCQPPEGFGYELRIWPAVTGYGPMGVTDAVANQQDFYCDPQSNVASYRVEDIKGTPGVTAISSGKFLWDVAFIQLDPYNVVLSSGPQLFEIP